jgi:hypothetical protein
MIRFVPDTPEEVLLRPLLMADSVGGLYVELQAPDLRFALLVLLLPVAWWLAGRRALFSPVFGRLLVGMCLCFYLWVLVSGNGRYFLWGLLVIGPLLVAVARHCGKTLAMRNTVIVGALALQLILIESVYKPNVWSLNAWREGPGLHLEPTPLAREPAVFVALGTVSHSLLVPLLHPQSRWTNLAGQQDWTPGTLEHERLMPMLHGGGMPRYAVLPVKNKPLHPSPQSRASRRAAIDLAVAPYGLETQSDECLFVASRINARLSSEVADPGAVNGYRFCPLVDRPTDKPHAFAAELTPQQLAAFEAVERHCPRLFPPGSAVGRVDGEGVARRYSHSDTTVYINSSGWVYLRSMRALNPTDLGAVSDVTAGRITLDCRRLPGRYVPPWARE